MAPPERPSPLRVCRYLGTNKLNGNVPSSLSTLTNLSLLCVAPSCQRRLRACGRVGSDRAALLRARGMSGVACREHRAGAVRQQGLMRYSQRGLRARDVTEEYSRGTLCMGTVRGYRRGTPLPWVRRSTAERPSPLRVCRYLGTNELNGSVPSSLSTLTNLESLCVPPSCQRLSTALARARRMRVGIGRLCSERAACRGLHVGSIEWRRCGSRAVAVLSEGTSGTSCD